MFNPLNIFNSDENQLSPYDEQQIAEAFQDYVDGLPSYLEADAPSAVYNYAVVTDFTRELNLSNIGGQFTTDQIQKILERNTFYLH